VTFNLEHWQWRDKTLYQIWTQSINPRRSYCNLNIWPITLTPRVTYCARLWDNFQEVWPSTTYPCLNYSVVSMLMRYITLWPWPLTSWPWKFVAHQASRLERNGSIPGWIIDDFAIFCTRYVAFWPWPLSCWPWTFTAFKLSCVYTLHKSWDNPFWVIDDLAHITPCNFRGGAFLSNGSQGCVDPTSHRTCQTRKAIISTREICFRVLISCCIFKSGELKFEWCLKQRRISHFLPHSLWKLGEGTRYLYQLKFCLWLNLRNTRDGHPLCGCWSRWIDNKEKKECSWVKLNVFRPN